MDKLVVNNLSKSFAEVQALKAVDLSLAEGKVLAVLGPSGCGKTTLLRCLAGFEIPESGSIQVDGATLFDSQRFVKPERRKIGYVPQHGVLFPHLTVAKNIGFGLPKRTMSTEQIRHRVEEMLELVGMVGLGSRMPHELSGGQQQRIALARALAPSPALVLLDEPFSALDAGLRQSLREEVKNTLNSINATAIIVTHDQEEALSMADSVAVMREGECIQMADPVTIYRHPADLKVATFVGEASLIQGRVTGAHADTQIGSLPLAQAGLFRPGDTVTVMLRPEQFVLSNAAQDTISAQVLKSVYCGHSTLVEVQISAALGNEKLQVRLHGAQQFQPGESLHLQVQGQAMAYAAEQGEK